MKTTMIEFMISSSDAIAEFDEAVNGDKAAQSQQ